MNIKELDKKYIANTYNRFDLLLEKGKGSVYTDDNGKEYIDLGSGIAVNSLGVCDDDWKNAIINQLSKLQHTSNLYYTEPCAVLAKKLCEKSGMKKVFFSNSGAEANECAIKCARKYANDKYGEGHHTIIILNNSFHGRTVTTLSATGQDKFHKDFMPFTDGFVYSEHNIESIKKLAKENKCAAIMFETIQGEGGVCPLDEKFINELSAFAAQEDLLLILDEVQTGNGRTGKYFSYMHYGLKPDVVTTAKGLAGGLPIGATLFSEKTENVFTPGTHGSTFGGNPICCAAAISVTDKITDEFMDEIVQKSEYIFNELTVAKGVEGVYGKGLMIGIKTEKPAPEVIKSCMEKGVLVLSAKDKVRLLPPLNISWQDLKKSIEIIKEVLAK